MQRMRGVRTRGTVFRTFGLQMRGLGVSTSCQDDFWEKDSFLAHNDDHIFLEWRLFKIVIVMMMCVEKSPRMYI